MDPKRRLYEELGVRHDATPAAIDKAYRQKARKAHPDTGGSSEAFHKLSHAYAILSDADRRKAYDETGYEGEMAGENIADRAMAHIHELVSSVLESDLPFEGVDLVTAIGDTLARQRAEIGAAIRKLESQAKRADAMAKRFHRKSGQKGDNLIRAAIERRAADIRQNAERTRHQEAIFAKAIDLIADYDFEHEAPKPTVAATPSPRSGADPIIASVKAGRAAKSAS
ncbi:DnaJ domain-containing protein [Kaistia dalseonensis]|uniref:Curved DNA-binding protein CbpA n=1 Tax=Kaistia dalseonensis TaxID=410840 RepID=A0ABU0H5W2_9HYPH|nr:DnaJ domain-containing protein [Kaistia dalseonensis]MCX5495105.1 DnaJ domain-containing protein [Kaistia dalseonensis]MDQ0437687.1 curved DNA-binding protein CbpA [Kaistia dalseonensis]